MLALVSLLSSEFFLLFALAFVLSYLVVGVVRRLYFSPLAKFPGPKLAALTFWVEFYYDVLQRGQYTFEIVKMHKKYGPIVRITPDELHIDDPDYYDVVFPGPSKTTDKHSGAARRMGKKLTWVFSPLSVFGTVSHDLHRARRAVLNPFFSKRSVTHFASSITSAVDKLCVRLEEVQNSRQPINLKVAFGALTLDIISQYSFARSFNTLADPDFASGTWNAMFAMAELSMLLKQYPWLATVAKAMPKWLVGVVNPNMMKSLELREITGAQVKAIMNGQNDDYKDATHPTIFHQLLNSDGPVEEKSLGRLNDEAITVVGAGMVTTANVLAVTSYYILEQPHVLHRLRTELQTVMPDPTILAPLTQLERLPYLTAIISEGLRLSHGVVHRLQRVAPDRALTFNDCTIPPGTAVSMSAYTMHTNPTIFPEPQEFRPERWLKQDSTYRLQKYLVSFSKGTRACQGLNFAYAELYLTFAAVFRRINLVLYETTRADVDVVHDFLVGVPRLDSKGIRVTVEPFY